MFDREHSVIIREAFRALQRIATILKLRVIPFVEYRVSNLIYAERNNNVHVLQFRHSVTKANF